MGFHGIYPLVNVYITMEYSITSFNGKITINCHFQWLYIKLPVIQTQILHGAGILTFPRIWAMCLAHVFCVDQHHGTAYATGTAHWRMIRNNGETTVEKTT